MKDFNAFLVKTIAVMEQERDRLSGQIDKLRQAAPRDVPPLVQRKEAIQQAVDHLLRCIEER